MAEQLRKQPILPRYSFGRTEETQKLLQVMLPHSPAETRAEDFPNTSHKLLQLIVAETLRTTSIGIHFLKRSK